MVSILTQAHQRVQENLIKKTFKNEVHLFLINYLGDYHFACICVKLVYAVRIHGASIIHLVYDHSKGTIDSDLAKVVVIQVWDIYIMVKKTDLTCVLLLWNKKKKLYTFLLKIFLQGKCYVVQLSMKA